MPYIDIHLEDNMDVNSQIDILATYILDKHPREVKNGGAIEIAIRIMEKQRQKIEEMEAHQKEADNK